MKIYHNPRCRKSRETLAIIESKGIEPEVVLYLDKPPNAAELAELIQMLGISAESLLRKEESVFKEQFKGQEHTDADWIDIMIQEPKLIQRPIVVKDGKAILGRPPENVMELIQAP